MHFWDLFTCKGTYMIDWVGRPPLGVTFSKAQSSKLERLFCNVSVKRDVRALSFELWNSIRKCHPKVGLAVSHISHMRCDLLCHSSHIWDVTYSSWVSLIRQFVSLNESSVRESHWVVRDLVRCDLLSHSSHIWDVTYSVIHRLVQGLCECARSELLSHMNE